MIKLFLMAACFAVWCMSAQETQKKLPGNPALVSSPAELAKLATQDKGTY